MFHNYAKRLCILVFDMIILRLWGGLGNQMFQYFFAYNLASKYNHELILDISFYDIKYFDKNKRFTKQNLDIINYPLIYKNIYQPTIGQYRKIAFLQNKYINRLIRVKKINYLKISKNLIYIKEGRSKYHSELKLNQHFNYYLDGYWQKNIFIRESSVNLFNQFVLNSNRVKEYIESNSFKEKITISVHIRRGDFTNKNVFHKSRVLSLDYYQRAIDYFESLFEKVSFYLFSNDISWVVENLNIRSEKVFITNNDSFSTIEELEIMSYCNHNIISNSTFGWWGAYMNRNKGKIVVAPKDWIYTDDMNLEKWIEL